VRQTINSYVPNRSIRGSGISLTKRFRELLGERYEEDLAAIDVNLEELEPGA